MLEGNFDAFDDPVVEDVFLQDFFHVARGFWGVPDVIWVNHHSGAVFAGVQTAGLIDPHFSFQPHFFHPAFGVIEQVEATAPDTTAPWIIGLALVIAYEDMFLKSCHACELRAGYFFWFFASSSMTDSTSSCFRHSQTFKLEPMK